MNPLSRREVLKFGAFTTVGGVLTPGIVLAQAVVTDTKGIVGPRHPASDARARRSPPTTPGPRRRAATRSSS